MHNWESGFDATPAYDPAFHVMVTEVNRTAWARLYPKFHQLLKTYKYQYDWDVAAVLARQTAPEAPGQFANWFVVKDVAVNSVYAAGWRILGDLAAELGDTATQQRCEQQYEVSRSAILRKLWIPAQGHFNTIFVDYDGSEQASVANTVQNLFPLLLPDLPADKVQLLAAQLADESKFATPFAIPTVARDDPQFCATFEADLMWRGPVWGFTNWFVLEGLGEHGQWALQGAILDKWVKLVQLAGINEDYNPLTGEALGAEGLGMSTLVCDYIFRYDMQ